MRGRDNKTLLIQSAKHNPVYQSLIDNIDNIDIDTLKQPKWVRDALTRIKIEGRVTDLMSNFKDVYNEDFIGEMYRYNGPEQFIFFGKTELLVMPNDLLFVVNGCVYLDAAFSKIIDARLTRMFIKSCKFSEYKSSVRAEVNARHSNEFKEDDGKGFVIKKWNGEYPEN